MKSIKLYEQLEKDFIKPGLSDDWFQYMGSVADFLTDNFKQRSMGLVCDFNTETNKVYTAVFPSNKVMKEVLDKNEEDILLFVHHPATWDIRKAPEVFQQMTSELLEKFRERKISIYNLHVPLDNFGEYSTSVSLAKVLDVKTYKPFASYFGSLSGVFGKTKVSLVTDFENKYKEVLGHDVKLYAYGENEISNQSVGIIAGGGNEVELLKEIAEENINLFITGISVKNSFSEEAHKFAQKNGINILGGTHYSTEKFACLAMCDYFKKLGLASEFIEELPVMEDL